MDKKEAFEKLTSVREFFTVSDIRNFYMSMLIDYIKEGGNRDYCDFEEVSIESQIRAENLSYWSSLTEVQNEILIKVVDLLFPLVDRSYKILKDNSDALIQRLLESQEWRTLPNEYTD
jgi:hypothetical protein